MWGVIKIEYDNKQLYLHGRRLGVALVGIALLASCASTPHSLDQRAAENETPYGTVQCHDIENDDEPGFNPNNIQVTSWNMFKGLLPGWQDDLAELIQSSNLMLLQEVPLIPEVTDGFPSTWNWQFAPGFRRADLQTGVMSSASAAALSSCTTKHREPWIRTPKALITTTYPISGTDETLMVGNIHAINYAVGTRAFRRQISTLADLVAAHDGPVIVGGDFNDWRQKRTDVILDLFGELGLRPVTFQSLDRLTVFGRPVDHIYYRGLEITRNEIRRVPSSDHNPILVGFKLDSAWQTNNSEQSDQAKPSTTRRKGLRIRYRRH